MEWTSIAGAINSVAAADGASIGQTKTDVIAACAQGLIQTRWRGCNVAYCPAIARAQWVGADVDMASGVVITADGLRMAMVELNKADLDAWMAKRQPAPAPVPGRRYATDDALVAEGVKGVCSDKWPNAHQAAKALAAKAEGPSNETKIGRLERKIIKALGTAPQNITKHPD